MLFQQHSLESKLNDFHQSLKPIALQFPQISMIFDTF